jgi:DNA polymerase-4
MSVASISPRKIIHLDMDCFYAAVELRERPELVGRPVAVGGGSRRGVVTTCNYEARAFGVGSAMPGFMARERCPTLVFLPPRFELYREVSQQVRAILHRHTDLVEPLSLDEAYLDVSANGRFAWDIAREIRAQIRTETGLTASAGVAANKMLAKIASDWRKPNGQFAILPAEADAFLSGLPVRKLWGVGPKSAERFSAEGVHTCGDLQRISRGELAATHGRWGEELFRLCRGIDDRPVEPHRERKSLSNEATFGENLSTFAACRKEMEILAGELLVELGQKAAERVVRKAFVKIKYADFTRTTHECVCAQPTVEKFVELLTGAHSRRSLPVRLLGSGVRFADETHGENPQLDLFA